MIRQGDGVLHFAAAAAVPLTCGRVAAEVPMPPSHLAWHLVGSNLVWGSDAKSWVSPVLEASRMQCLKCRHARLCSLGAVGQGGVLGVGNVRLAFGTWCPRRHHAAARVPTRGSPAMPTLEMWLELGYAPVRVQSSRSFGLTLWHREPTRLSLGIGMLLLSVFLAVGNGRLAAGFWLRPLWSPGYTTQGIIEASQCGCLLRSAGRSFPGMSLPRQAV